MNSQTPTGPFSSSTKLIIGIVAVFILVVVGIAGADFLLTHDFGMLCTADARLCPGGGGVGRTGLFCRFPACPNIE